ncbi:MAG: hypothetical protein ACJAY8_001216 [Sphingobacteriales bacterium]|jgi:hypothetical protein
MKNTYNHLLALVLITGCFSLQAQTSADALRFSQYSPQGSARFQSLAGAFGSLGGEPSGIHLNPGTLGEFRSNHFSFSLGSASTTTNTKFFDNVAPETNSLGLTIGNFGFIFSSPITQSDWKYFSFGITYNRMLDFRSQYSIEGNTPINSVHDFANSALGLTPDQLNEYDPLYSDLAFATEVIVSDPNDPSKTSYVANDFSEDAVHYSDVQSRGRLSETGFSGGANYKNKWFLGAEIGIPTIAYRVKTGFEEFSTDSTTQLESYSFSNETRVNGSGFNFKIGAVYKVNQKVRVGLALHSPSYFTLRERSFSDMQSVFRDRIITAGSEEFSYNYQLTTPGKLVASGSLVIGKAGFVSLNYVTYNPSLARFRNTDFFESDFHKATNEEIRTVHKSVHNLAVGVEYRVSYLSFRGGWGLQTNPYKSEFIDNEKPTQFISGGLGIKNGNYYLDFGFSSQSLVQDYYISSYVPEPASVAERKSTFQFTLGYRFK